jgi:uncharacterized RDD family membrane protein YckC
MNPPEAQSESDKAAAYFDPEAQDLSEQVFSASLESPAERPQFVVDEEENSENVPEQTPAIGSSEHVSFGATEALASDASGTPEQSALSRSDPSTPELNPDWREQVSAKVNKYKSRSQHKVRYPSLQLQFESGSYRAQSGTDDTAKSVRTFSQSMAAEIVALQTTPILESEPRISLDATARVLEFPRPMPPPVDPDELAERMIDRPRILEAPELLPPPPAMGGILIEPQRTSEPERRPGFDMPLRSSPLGRRVWSGVIDALLLAIALSLFGYVFVRITGALPRWQTTAQVGASLLALLWPAYEYAFLVFSETTPGLRLAKLEVQRFDGTPAPRNLRRWRVLASVLSAVSLGLGYAWCLLDEDQLSWHDRITRTHLAPVNSSVTSGTVSA